MSALEALEVGLCSVSLNPFPVAKLLLLQGIRVVLGVSPDRILDQIVGLFVHWRVLRLGSHGGCAG